VLAQPPRDCPGELFFENLFYDDQQWQLFPVESTAIVAHDHPQAEFIDFQMNVK